MNKAEAEKLLARLISVKEASDDMAALVSELKKLPKGQLKKLQADDALVSVLGKYGVEI